MPEWLGRVKIKHLLTEKDDWESVQTSMTQIAGILERRKAFSGFDVLPFRSIPKGDTVFGPADYANRYLASMYDFADSHRIWIE